MAHLPLRPFASLPELQNWNLRGNNPLPPYQYDIIGNSEANPLFPKNGIVPTTPVQDLQHDDAYCANHLLFDDWFFSSIAPEPTTLGGTISKNIEAVYEDYLQGNAQLTNRAYRPIAEDRDLSPTDAADIADTILNSPEGDGWLKVASRFEVEGMFNVNSTSVKAWRALLGHARNRQVAHHSASGGIVLDTEERDHVVMRNTIASDIKAGEDPGIGAAFPSGSEYAGFRTLNGNQLDELAIRIVEQVRARGPFLSLSEFVNRQLSTDDDLAMAGALQAALDSLSEDPLASLKNEGPDGKISSVTMDAADSKLDGVGYEYKKAAEGYNIHGFPGWIRQADILRPIAPVLSARDDTFTIRAYGDKRDAAGNVVARAWCEAVVQRSRDFVDPADAADSIEPPVSEVNKAIGRRYVIQSFRWINADEV
jgi:hypothetical protein